MFDSKYFSKSPSFSNWVKILILKLISKLNDIILIIGKQMIIQQLKLLSWIDQIKNKEQKLN